MRVRAASVATVLSLSLVLTGCGSSSEDSAADSSKAAPSSGADESTTSSSSEAPSSTPQPSSPAAQSCAAATLAALTPQQRVAQLIMIAEEPGTEPSAHQAITDGQAGSVVMLGKWQGHDAVSTAVQEIDALSASTGGVGIWVATDQEGGQVQKLTGDGFSDMPAALTQGALSPEQLMADATTWATELSTAGVDINLAPVADVVPPELGKGNGPIGAFDRQFGSTPAEVSPPMLTFAQGMTAGGVLPTVKHFPGIGRITGNTDETTVGTEDAAMTASDPDLQPFADAVAAQVPLVMVSSASYPQLDPANRAMFSEPIITGLLRQKLGFGGIVITDDVGSAKAVSDVPVPERATRFIAAGGDIVLTAQPAQADDMNAAVVAQMSADPTFAAKVDAAALRVLTQKDAGKLLPCSA